MKYPHPTKKDHEAFCVSEGWTQVRNARGRRGSHHLTFELVLADGRVLRTRVSHPVDRTDYGPSIWGHILRDQLQVSEAEFWSCVRDGQAPARGIPEIPRGAIPANVVVELIGKVGLGEAEVAAMTRDEAIARANRYWTEGI